MTYVCECIFEDVDPAHPNYSLTEYDLLPAVGPRGEAYSIRRQVVEDVYEIFDYQHDRVYSQESVWYRDPKLEDVVSEAQELEEAAAGKTFLEYGHSPDTVQCQLTWRDTLDEQDNRDVDYDQL